MLFDDVLVALLLMMPPPLISMSCVPLLVMNVAVETPFCRVAPVSTLTSTLFCRKI
jgi:hypothetical protein